MAGLAIGVVAVVAGLAAAFVLLFTDGLIFGLLDNAKSMRQALWVTACDISLAGAAVGVCVVALLRVWRLAGALRVYALAWTGIVLGLGVIGVCCFPWLLLLLGCAAAGN
jgi:hypothetical protein